jgi:hypothetical protein
MLTYQLMEVKDLTEIMYNAKIHDLKRIKRIPASSDDNNQNDFIDKKATTNDVAIVTPYELTFQGFSTELARVMEGLVNSKNCFVIRSVVVTKVTEDTQAAAASVPVNPAAMYNSMSRYSRYAPPPPVAAAPRPQRPSSVLLDENKLQFVLQVEAVRLKPGVTARPARQPVTTAQVSQQ